MRDREAILKIIDDAYATRMSGDKAALEQLWAPGGVYHFAGDPNLLPDFPVGPTHGAPATSALVDLFTFHSLERLDSVVEGGTAAVRWRVILSTEGKEPVTTEILDLWTIDGDGKIGSLVQFGDTALVAGMLT